MKSKFFIGIILSMILISIFSVSSLGADSTYVRTLFLNQDPDPAEPGKFIELRWRVYKGGDDTINNLKYRLEPEYPFSLDTGSEDIIEIGDWFGAADSEEYYTLYYKLRVADDALEDTYKLKLSRKHNSLPDWVTTEYDIRIGDKKVPKFVIGTLVSSPTKLISDIDEAELEVEIENIGDGDAENVKVEIALPEGFSPSYGYSDRDNLGTIGASSSKTAKFYMDLDKSLIGKEYMSNITVQYKDADDDTNEFKKLVLPLYIPVKDKPSFEVISVESSPEQIMPGDSVDLKILLKNVGGKEAESLSIRAFKESSQPFEFDEKSDFVGKLKPGETGEAVLKFTVDKDATSKVYLVELETRAVDGSEVLIESHSANIQIMQGSQSKLVSTILSPLGLVMIIGAVVLAGYFAWRKQSK